ncbi:hypothetical protein JG687_00006867 [Phytophthora cactorum]|uniref:M96 mating-specific protein family n=1 Tax=Phytophthora cactorum TaxID=29920 RepID=A0A8T1UGQ9_9STRA|nr:hypothetical protein JG687_00006867 [Phytophthora cactorum]
MAFLTDDDDAFEAVLSFVDDFAADESLPDDGVVDSLETEEQLRGDELEMPTIEDMHLQVDGDAATCIEADAAPGLRRSLRLSQRTSGCSNVSADTTLPGSLRSIRRVAIKAKKKMVRKAGVYADPNRARNERKLEITYLREKVGQLETELQSVRERSSRPPIELGTLSENGRRPAEQSAAHASESQLSTAPSTWKEIASHRRSEREEAERENVRLKLVLASQIKVAKDLESILLKRARQQIAECSASIQRRVDVACPSGHTLDFRADAADFQGLLQYLDDAYSQVDTVLAANGLTWKEMTLHDVQMREGVNGMYLEVFSNKVLPFGLHATAEATWNYFKGSKKHRGTLYAKEAQDLDTLYTVIEHFSKELVAGNSSTDVRIKQIVRRYVEAHREIVVWVASITPVNITQKPFGGFTSRHRSYAVIKRAKASTPQHELSLLQLVSHGMLDTQTGTIYDPKYVRALTDFLLNDAARNIKADQQLIENVLMDQMLRP